MQRKQPPEKRWEMRETVVLCMSFGFGGQVCCPVVVPSLPKCAVGSRDCWVSAGVEVRASGRCSLGRTVSGLP